MPERVHRPWGWFETLVTGNGYLVKRLRITAERRISLQRHHHRSEHWVVVYGQGELTWDGHTSARAWFHPVHPLRCSASGERSGTHGLVIVEGQRGEELLEDDIERLRILRAGW